MSAKASSSRVCIRSSSPPQCPQRRASLVHGSNMDNQSEPSLLQRQSGRSKSCFKKEQVVICTEENARLPPTMIIAKSSPENIYMVKGRCFLEVDPTISETLTNIKTMAIPPRRPHRRVSIENSGQGEDDSLAGNSTGGAPSRVLKHAVSLDAAMDKIKAINRPPKLPHRQRSIETVATRVSSYSPLPLLPKKMQLDETEWKKLKSISVPPKIPHRLASIEFYQSKAA